MYTTLEEIKEAVVNSLTVQLIKEESFDAEILNSKVVSALAEVQSKRNYPESYTADMVVKDMNRFVPVIEAVSMFDYNQVGVEGETSHSENGVSRKYLDRAKLFYGVLPFASIT